MAPQLSSKLAPAPSKIKNPTLDDLFAGRARFQTIQESDEVKLAFSTSIASIYDQKMPIFKNPNDGFWYAITRGHMTNPANYNVFLFKSSDGIHFQQVGDALFPNLSHEMAIYDAHVAVDESTSPATYIMSLECTQFGGQKNPFGPSICISTSTSPWDPISWSVPKLIVRTDGQKSASTAAVLVDNGKYYLKWTMVDDGSFAWNVGTESSSTWATQITNLTNYKGLSTQAGSLLIGAYQNTHCTNSWDCNNVDVQDWKKINNYYYAIYNGANYYRCTRKNNGYLANTHGNDYDFDNFTSEWGLAIRRSSQALGRYDESSGPLIMAERKDTCGISYPVLNDLNGELYLYYAYYPLSGPSTNKTMRSKLIWSAGQASVTSPMPLTPVILAQPYPFVKSCDLNALSAAAITNENKVKYMYCLILNRHADTAGLNGLTQSLNNSSTTVEAALATLFGSPEFESIYQLSGMTNSQYITLLYGQLYYRSPDKAGYDAALAQLQSGITRHNLFTSFIQSAEFKNSNYLLR